MHKTLWLSGVLTPYLSIFHFLIRKPAIFTTMCAVSIGFAHANDESQMLGDVIQKIEKAHNAKAFEIEVENDKGQSFYEIDTLRNGEFYESMINPVSAQILSDKKEDSPLWKPLNYKEKEELLSAKISLGEAIQSVASKNSSPLKLGIFTLEGGKGYFELTFENGNRYRVNAVSGSVEKI